MFATFSIIRKNVAFMSMTTAFEGMFVKQSRHTLMTFETVLIIAETVSTWLNELASTWVIMVGTMSTVVINAMLTIASAIRTVSESMITSRVLACVISILEMLVILGLNAANSSV